jgi:uncharacterized protein GlcG (DUF336 family)
MSLDIARRLLDAVLDKGSSLGLMPTATAVLDSRGGLEAFGAQDRKSLMRGEVAQGKAYGALALGVVSRAIFREAQERAYFIGAVASMAHGKIISVHGGVLIRDGSGALGAVGVSGDMSNNDKACCAAGIEAVGLRTDTG